MNRYCLISFDVDDTLWDFPAMQRKGTEAIAVLIRERLGDAYAHLTADALLAAYRQRVSTGAHDPTVTRWLELRRQVYSAALAEAGYADHEAFSHEMAALYYATRNTDIPLYPGVREVLDALRGRFRLGWVTNGNETPDLIGLESYFDVVITPDRDRLRKPDPAVFQLAAERAGCPVTAILHIGDNLRSDVGGAQAAGAAAVWFNPRGRVNDSEHTPDAEIADLRDLLPLVDGA